jgi:O-antigen ligase
MIVILIPITITKKEPLLFFSQFMGVLTIFLTQSRSSWTALFIIAIFTLIFYKRKFTNLIKFIGIRRVIIYTILLIMSTSFVIIPRTLRSLNVLKQGGSYPLRVEMIKEAKQAITLNPWVGYGIGTNEITLFRLFPRGYNFSFPAPVHDAYFQIALESGIFGLFFLLFPFIYLFRKIVINMLSQKNISKDLSFIAISGICSFLIFYIFLPHEGIREFAYLGIILGYAMIAVYQYNLKAK